MFCCLASPPSLVASPHPCPLPLLLPCRSYRAAAELLVEVFDWDKESGDDDEMGSVTLNLGNLVDGLPHETWYPLANGGKNGEIRLTVQAEVDPVAAATNAAPAVSTSATAGTSATGGGGAAWSGPTSGKLHVKVLRARDLVVADNDCDPLCRVAVGGRQQETDKIKKSRDPVWNEQMSFDWNVAADGTEVAVGVWDWDRFGSNDLVGEATVSLLGLDPETLKVRQRCDARRVYQRLRR